MARLYLFIWELLELSTLKYPRFFVPAAAILVRTLRRET
jgi:hypothetical protein